MGGHSLRDLTLRRATQRRAYQRSAKPLKEIWNRGGHAKSDLTYAKVTQKRAYQHTAKPLKEVRNRGGHPSGDLTQKRATHTFYSFDIPSSPLNYSAQYMNILKILFEGFKSPPPPIPQSKAKVFMIKFKSIIALGS